MDSFSLRAPYSPHSYLRIAFQIPASFAARCPLPPPWRMASFTRRDVNSCPSHSFSWHLFLKRCRTCQKLWGVEPRGFKGCTIRTWQSLLGSSREELAGYRKKHSLVNCLLKSICVFQWQIHSSWSTFNTIHGKHFNCPKHLHAPCQSFIPLAG